MTNAALRFLLPLAFVLGPFTLLAQETPVETSQGLTPDELKEEKELQKVIDDGAARVDEKVGEEDGEEEVHGELETDGVSEEGSADEEMDDGHFRRPGMAVWFSPLFSSPGLHKRTAFSSHYAHPSVTTPIAAGDGNILHVLRALGVGVRLVMDVLTVQFEASLMGLSFAGVPGHRDMEATILNPGGRLLLELYPFPALPLYLKTEGSLYYAPEDYETESGETKEWALSLLSLTGGLHVGWELVSRRHLVTPILAVDVGALWMYNSGRFAPEGTFPGVEFESSQLMYGSRLCATVPFTLMNLLFAGASEGGSRQDSIKGPNYLTLGLGAYAGPGSGYMITWTVDWRMGGSSTE